MSREDARPAFSIGQRSRVCARDAFDRVRRLPSATAQRGRHRLRPRTRGVAAVGDRGSCSSRGAASWILRPLRSRAEPRCRPFHSRSTELAGEETSPSLSPDGSTVAYAVRVNGSWDIYSQRVGGRNATPIVNDPQRDEGGPAFSPDGSSDRVSRVGRLWEASSSQARRVNLYGGSPTSVSIRRGRRTVSRSRSPPRRSSIRPRGSVTARLYVVDGCRRYAAQAGRRATARSRRGPPPVRESSTGATPAANATSTPLRRTAARGWR